MGHQLGGGIIQHGGFWTRGLIFRQDAINTAVAHDGGHAPFFDAVVAGDPAFLILVAPVVIFFDLGGKPCFFLNDSAVEVGDVQPTIRPAFGPDRAEVGVATAHELAFGKSVMGGPDALIPFEPAHTEQAPDRLAGHGISVKFWHEVTANDGLSAGGGKSGQNPLFFYVVPAVGKIPDWASGPWAFVPRRVFLEL